MPPTLYLREISLRETPPADDYLGGLPVVRALAAKPIAFRRPVTFFVGENGVGKSTLIEALAVALGFNPEGGTKNFHFATEETHSRLFDYIRVARSAARPRDGFFLRAESFYNAATNIDVLDREASFGPPVIDSYGGISLHRQSHGESFLSLVENRFGGAGLYILDEPEAALSPMRLLRLLADMQALVEADSQFVISTHSPILMAFPGAEIYEIRDAGIESVPYKETEHYRVTRQFLENPEQMLHYLLDDGADADENGPHRHI